MPDPQQWDEAAELRPAVLAMPNGMSADQPFADVYQAALFLAVYRPWEYFAEPGLLYRGQSDHLWSLTPVLYRPERPFSSNVDERRAELRAATDRVCGLVRQLQASHPSVSDEQGVAIVQHYSHEAKCGTWLIDFTRDPFILKPA